LKSNNKLKLVGGLALGFFSIVGLTSVLRLKTDTVRSTDPQPAPSAESQVASQPPAADAATNGKNPYDKMKYASYFEVNGQRYWIERVKAGQNPKTWWPNQSPPPPTNTGFSTVIFKKHETFLTADGIKFPVDIIFADRTGKYIQKIYRNVQPCTGVVARRQKCPIYLSGGISKMWVTLHAGSASSLKERDPFIYNVLDAK
jgi:hypothetical protein